VLWCKAINGNLSLPLRNKLLTQVRKINLIKYHLSTKFLPKIKTKCEQCQICSIKSHEEDSCCFKLKAIQEAQHKAKQQVQQKPNEALNEAFAVDQAKISEFSDVTDDVKEMPEMQEILDNMYIEVCNHYVTLNKSET
jgi:hypothetical protein